jgi:hypothetical protein
VRDARICGHRPGLAAWSTVADMAVGPRSGFYYAAASIPLMVAGIFGPDVFHLSLEAKTIAFYGSLGLAALCVVIGAIRELRSEAGAPVTPGHRRRMIAIAGMFISGIAFLTFAAIYFWPERPANPTASLQTITPPAPSFFQNPSTRLGDISNAELRERAGRFTSRLLTFSAEFDVRDRQQNEIEWDAMRRALTEEEKNRKWDQMMQNQSDRRQRHQAEFKVQFLPTAQEYQDAICNRLGIFPPYDGDPMAVALHTGLAALTPNNAANYLNQLIRKLPE